MNLEPYRERFMLRVERRAPDACWPWLAWCTKSGHGRFCTWDSSTKRVRGQMAHRMAWVFAHGEIPDGKQVLHRCDNPPCCNPAHLWLGYHHDNMRDRQEKGGYGSACRGEAHGMAKLTEPIVREMMDLRTDGATLNELALAYGVTEAMVSLIAKGKKWKHLGLGATVPNRSTSAQARKTHCRSGHPYSEENTRRLPSGERRCRICVNANQRAHQARKAR